MKKSVTVSLLLAVFTLGVGAQINRTDVYIGGSYDIGFLQTRACYWVNGYMQLIDGISVDAIYVESNSLGSTVYTAGVYQRQEIPVNTLGDFSYVTTYRYWINGIPYELPECRSVDKILVDNGKVYVFGMYDDNNTSDWTYWIDGIRQPKPSDGYVRDITVVNGVVYMAGFHFIENTVGFWDRDPIRYACYWIDGIRYDLPNSENFYAFGIKVENGRTYVGGNFSLRACYWIDGVQSIIFNTEYIAYDKDFIVSDGIVYMFGYNPRTYYANGIPQNFKSEYAGCYTISQGIMYVGGGYYPSGRSYPTPCYWIDNVPHNLYLSPGVSGSINIKDIFVVER